MTATFYSTKELAERLTEQLGFTVSKEDINQWRNNNPSSVPSFAMKKGHVLIWRESSVMAWVEWIKENTRAGKGVGG